MLGAVICYSSVRVIEAISISRLEEKNLIERFVLSVVPCSTVFLIQNIPRFSIKNLISLPDELAKEAKRTTTADGETVKATVKLIHQICLYEQRKFSTIIFV